MDFENFHVTVDGVAYWPRSFGQNEDLANVIRELAKRGQLSRLIKNDHLEVMKGSPGMMQALRNRTKIGKLLGEVPAETLKCGRAGVLSSLFWNSTRIYHSQTFVTQVSSKVLREGDRGMVYFLMLAEE